MFGRRGIADTTSPPPAPPAAGTPLPASQPAATPSVAMPVSNGAAREAELLGARSDEAAAGKPKPPEQDELSSTREKIYNLLMEQIDVSTSSRLPRDELKRQ